MPRQLNYKLTVSIFLIVVCACAVGRYYSYTELFSPPNRRLQAVNALLVRLSGTAQPALSGKGLFFEEVSVPYATTTKPTTTAQSESVSLAALTGRAANGKYLMTRGWPECRGRRLLRSHTQICLNHITAGPLTIAVVVAIVVVGYGQKLS